MNKWIVATVIVVAAGSAAGTTATAAGGNGTSFCSGSSAPDGYIVIGDLGTYNNAGEFVSALAPLPGDPGFGWNVQSVCNPNRFEP